MAVYSPGPSSTTGLPQVSQGWVLERRDAASPAVAPWSPEDAAVRAAGGAFGGADGLGVCGAVRGPLEPSGHRCSRSSFGSPGRAALSRRGMRPGPNSGVQICRPAPSSCATPCPSSGAGSHFATRLAIGETRTIRPHPRHGSNFMIVHSFDSGGNLLQAAPKVAALRGFGVSGRVGVLCFRGFVAGQVTFRVEVFRGFEGFEVDVFLPLRNLAPKPPGRPC